MIISNNLLQSIKKSYIKNLKIFYVCARGLLPFSIKIIDSSIFLPSYIQNFLSREKNLMNPGEKVFI